MHTHAARARTHSDTNGRTPAVADGGRAPAHTHRHTAPILHCQCTQHTHHTSCFYPSNRVYTYKLSANSGIFRCLDTDTFVVSELSQSQSLPVFSPHVCLILDSVQFVCILLVGDHSEHTPKWLNQGQHRGTESTSIITA
jgi:hypothetical protein